MRRLFIMRKDLHMSQGKLAAQVAHCAEAYWLRGLREAIKPIDDFYGYEAHITIEKEIFENYIHGDYIKIICEAKNKNHLLKAKDMAEEIGLVENVHYGLIYDKCFTELEPEEADGTTLTGIWFMPLRDDVAYMISKQYLLYK